MTETRVNPSDGLLDVFHPDTNAWVRAIALLQVAGGIDIKLVGSQGQLLTQMAADAARLETILSALQSLSTNNDSLLQKSTQIALALDSNTNGTLGAIAQTLDLMNVQNSTLTDQTQAIATLLAGGYNYNTRFNEISTLLTQQEGSLVDLETAIEAVGTKVDAVGSAITGQELSNALIKTAPFANPDTEVAVILPDHTKTLRFRCRKSGSTFYDLRYSFESGQVAAGSRYGVLNGGSEYVQNHLNLVGAQLYLSCSNTTAVAEVEIWT